MAKDRKQQDQQKQQDRDQEKDLEQALQPEHREDLLGQMEENTNLTGSTTWETLGQDGDAAEEEPESDSDTERRG
ncbi:MAG TPA: hypothetical protein VFW98_10730 [Gemmatimonadaceae bacterium]|nr:hypothetical protein [Gemmatimonadaceae bacterium]